jgi:hypothetical protein
MDFRERTVTFLLKANRLFSNIKDSAFTERYFSVTLLFTANVKQIQFQHFKNIFLINPNPWNIFLCFFLKPIN